MCICVYVFLRSTEIDFQRTNSYSVLDFVRRLIGLGNCSKRAVAVVKACECTSHFAVHYLLYIAEPTTPLVYSLPHSTTIYYYYFFDHYIYLFLLSLSRTLFFYFLLSYSSHSGTNIGDAEAELTAYVWADSGLSFFAQGSSTARHDQ
jgi:hypothetical protein